MGDAGKPFEATLVPTLDGSGLVWTTRDIKPDLLDEAAALFREGMTVRAVGARLGIDRSKAGRLRLKAKDEGLLDADTSGGDDGNDTLH